MRVVIEYGPQHEQIGSVRLPEGVTEEQADEVAREVMRTISRLAREQEWEYPAVRTGVESE